MQARSSVAPRPLCPLICGAAVLCASATSAGAGQEPEAIPRGPLEVSAALAAVDRCTDRRGRTVDCIALNLSLAVACPGGQCLEGAVYPVDWRIARRIELDLGGYAPVALRQMYRALRALGRPSPAEQPHEDRVARALSHSLRWLGQHVHHEFLPGVILTTEAERYVAAVASAYRRRTGRRLVITSGTRTPRSQARAMYHRLRAGVSLTRLYRKREAAREIIWAYRRARAERLGARRTIARMEAVIRQQMARGVYISAHLRRSAVDIRSRNMTRTIKAALQRAAREVEGVKLNREERRPPHFHMEVGLGPDGEALDIFTSPEEECAAQPSTGE